ncbi:MAG: FtsW/RodA/SpoVE family cell cycle protein [Bacteroidales bacterium]|nr:FtsW/RodA/SpoVE family cell cycle protein [Bacteroidales bacterium]
MTNQDIDIQTPSAHDTPPVPREKRKSDKYIWAVYLTLIVVSIVEQYSASSREITSANVMAPILRHCLLLGIGLVITIAVSRVSYKWFIPLSPVFIVLSVLAMIYVLINGQVINGAARSFSLMGIQVQPPEFIKMSSVLFIALVMSRCQVPKGVTTRGVVICGGMVLFFSALLFSQGLTNTMLMMGISLTMLLIAGIQIKKFILLLLVYALAGGIGVYIKIKHGSTEETTLIAETGRDAQGNIATVNRTGIWKARLERYFGAGDTLQKWQRPIVDANRQEMYAYMAQANGGIIGVGPGNSRETARLPLANIDYVYSIVVEDTGLVGGLLLLLVYLSLLGRAGALAASCPRIFPALLIMGMAVYIVLQALCHMAIVTGVFPVSGQPLPLISKGGTSIFVTSIAFGIMLSVSRYVLHSKNKNQDTAATDLPENMQALNPTYLQKK